MDEATADHMTFKKKRRRYNNLFPSTKTRVNLPVSEVRQLAKSSWHRQWIRNYETMMAFKEKRGRFPGSHEVYKGIQIGNWITRQKTDAKRGLMPSWRREIWEKDPPVTLRPDWWNRFHQYEKWLEGHETPPTASMGRSDEERRLAMWRQGQKTAFNKGKLNRVQVQAMRRAGMFDSLGERHNRKRLAEFKEFVKNNKRLPWKLSTDKKERSISAWGKKVRYEIIPCSDSIRKSVLKAYSKYLWRNKHEMAWQKHYNAYLAFTKKNGWEPMKNRSDKHQFSLYIWRERQIILHNHGELPNHRFRLLNKYRILDLRQPQRNRNN